VHCNIDAAAAAFKTQHAYATLAPPLMPAVLVSALQAVANAIVTAVHTVVSIIMLQFHMWDFASWHSQSTESGALKVVQGA
jgi:hypothetical protein